MISSIPQIVVFNGWRLAPHCWRTFLLRPVRIEQVPGRWICVSVFGVAIFFLERRP
jgi:hypothetical protein